MSLPEESPEPLQHIQIGHIRLTVRAKDSGGTHYLQRVHTEEFHSPFYRILRQTLAPTHCIDIGANYGFTGLLMRHHFPDARLTMVEPVPWLKNFIIHNFQQNGAGYNALYSAICSDHHGGNMSTFGVRDTSSQDSRVVLQTGMRSVETDVVSVTGLALEIPPDAGVYLKIDTQGWEEKVFAGAEQFLLNHQRWFVKTEFAPSWLESQGTDPVCLLRRLTGSYRVFEAPGRHRWNCGSMSELTGQALVSGCEEAFVHYVRNLAREDKGWVDLYVMPPA